jgi:hypothetical protein
VQLTQASALFIQPLYGGWNEWRTQIIQLSK